MEAKSAQSHPRREGYTQPNAQLQLQIGAQSSTLQIGAQSSMLQIGVQSSTLGTGFEEPGPAFVWTQLATQLGLAASHGPRCGSLVARGNSTRVGQLRACPR
jgi:hypothetical protein